MNLNTRLIDITLGDFLNVATPIIRDIVKNEVVNTHDDDKWERGIKVIAETLGITKEYAWKLKDEGKFKKSIKQTGRTILVNRELLLEEFGKANTKK